MTAYAAGIIVKPSFEWRQTTYGEIRLNAEFARRMRMATAPEIYKNGNMYHNAFDIIGYNNTDYSAWTSSDGKQLCYSNAEMKSKFIENLKLYLADSSKCGSIPNLMVLGMEDNESWCTCASCAASKTSYGSDSAVMLSFINAVAKEINAEREKNGQKAITFIMFAYYATEMPPRNFTEEIHENVGVMFAPIKARFRSLFDAKINQPFKTNLAGWSAVTKNLYAWTYNFYTRSSFITYDTFDEMAPLYRLLQENGVKVLYDQTESYQPVSLAWGRLKGYLQSKLMWNTSLDVSALTNKWFKAYFQNTETANNMQRIYNETREMYDAVYAANRDNVEYSEIGQVMTSFACLSPTGSQYAVLKAELESWMETINAEMAKYEGVNDTLSDRIKLESLQYRYLSITVYGNEYSSSELTAMKRSFKTDATALGVTHYKENGPIGELWSVWGI